MLTRRSGHHEVVELLIVKIQTTSESLCCTTSLRYSHLYSYASNGNHQLLLADVLCGSVPCLYLTELAPSTDSVRCYRDCQVYEMGDEPLGHHITLTSTGLPMNFVNFSSEVGSCWSEVQSSLVAKQWQPGPT